MAQSTVNPVLFGGVLLFLAGSAVADDTLTLEPSPPGWAAPEFEPHELLVKFREGVTDGEAEAVLRSHAATAVRRYRAPRQVPHAAIGRWWHMRIASPGDTEAALEDLSGAPEVEAVELNYRVTGTRDPDDPEYPKLWGLHNFGQSGGSADADIDAPEAWDLQTGSSTVIVAVIDSGIDYAHPDLAANVWTNPGEIAGNGLDDDFNGYVDDVHGYDFYNNDADPFDDHGHGTHVAGTIGAVGNNGVGVAGVSWNTRMMALKFLGSNNAGSTAGAILSILYATDMGARISNNSWGGSGNSLALYEAISAAGEANQLFVASAGNDGEDTDRAPHYPAAFDLPNIISVAATDRGDRRVGFSNYGGSTVDLGAPGVAILSTLPTSGPASHPTGYGGWSGTSMAAPHVSGAAALLLSQEPQHAATGLKTLLMSTTDPVATLAGKSVSGGRLNVHRALTCEPTQLFTQLATPAPGFRAYAGATRPIEVAMFVCAEPAAGAQVTATFSNGEPSIALRDDGGPGDLAANDGIYSADWTPAIAGAVTVTVSASHALGGATRAATGEIRTPPAAYEYVEAPFTWDDVLDATPIDLGDNDGATIPLGFPYSFYGNAYTEVTISSNGYLTFGDSPYIRFNAEIPSRTVPNNLIAPFWDDLSPDRGGAVYWELRGDPPDRALVVSWVDVPHRAYTGGAVTFQVAIRESSEAIEFRYQDVVFGEPVADRQSAHHDFGASATVGVENDDALYGTQFSSDLPTLGNNRALVFSPNGQRPPLADAGGPYTGSRGLPVVFDGSRSSAEASRPLSYRWDFGDGATATGSQPSHAYLVAGQYRVTLIVNDGERDSTAAVTTATIVAPGVNRAPAPVDDNVTITEDQQAVLEVLANDADPDGDHLLITALGVPDAGGTVSHDGRRVRYRPPPGFSGEDAFSYTVSDGLAGASAAVRVQVIEINDPPSVGDDWIVLNEDQGTSFPALWNDFDPEGATLTIVSVSQPLHATALIHGETYIEYSPHPDYFGSDEFQYTVSDGVNTATGTIRVDIEERPDPAVDDTASVFEGGSVDIPVLDNDAEKADSVGWISDPPNGTAEQPYGVTGIRYRPDPGFSGTDVFHYSVDLGSYHDAAFVTVTVVPVDSAPVLETNAGITVAEGAFAQIDATTLRASDADNTPAEILYSVNVPPQHGQVTKHGVSTAQFTQADVDGGWLAYRHAGGENTQDSFGFTLSDTGTQSGTARHTFSISVTPVNDPPSAIDDEVAVPGNSAANAIAVLANDLDPDDTDLTIVAVSAARNGTTQIVGSDVHYTPSQGFHGADEFTYTVSDGAASDSGRVTVTVAAATPAPPPQGGSGGGALGPLGLAGFWLGWLCAVRRRHPGVLMR